MVSRTTKLTQEREKIERFPNCPPQDDMRNWLYLYERSVPTMFPIQYANVPNVMMVCEVPVSPILPVREDVRIPDLIFVRGGIRELMVEQRVTR